MQSVRSRIWTRVAVSISSDDNHYTTGTYADNIALLANTPTQDEFLLRSLEQAAGGNRPDVNANKTEYKCFNQNSKHLDTKW